MILDHKHLIIRAEVTDPPKSAEETKAWVIKLVDNIKRNKSNNSRCSRLNLVGTILFILLIEFE